MPNRSEQVTEVQAPGGAHVVVTLESIYSLTLETANGVSTANQKLDAAAATISDHEGRLRALEKRVYVWAGAVGTVGGGIGAMILEAVRGGG